MNIRKYKITKEELEAMIKEGLTIKEISFNLNIPYSTLCERLRDFGLSVKKPRNTRRLSITSERVVIKKYLEGESIQKIAQYLKIGTTTVLTALVKNNINRRTLSEAIRKYKTNENFFETIDTEEKAYFLGFLYADGNLFFKTGKSFKTRCTTLSLSEVDGYIVEKLRNLIYPNKDKKCRIILKEGSLPMVSLSIYNKKIYNDLLNKGLYPQKSLTLRFPSENTVLKDLVRHFLRGVFDGDGSISLRCQKGCNKQTATVQFTSNLEFCQDIQRELKNFNISTTVCSFKGRRYLGNCATQKIANIIAFYEIFYKDATIFLGRKHDKFIEFFNKRGITASIPTPVYIVPRPNP